MIKKTSSWLAPLIILLVAAGVFVLIAQVKNQPLGKADLKIALIELRSQAVQRKLLADAVRSNKATAQYTRGHLLFLADKTDGVLKDLTHARAESGIEETAFKARGLAEDLHAALAELSSAYRNQEGATVIGQKLQNNVDRLRELEATLFP
jgi:hypothetical protein